MMQYGLSDQVINEIKQIFTNFSQIEEVILYGSHAKGNYKKGSDIDLAVKGKNITISYLGKIRNALDDRYLFIRYHRQSFFNRSH